MRANISKKLCIYIYSIMKKIVLEGKAALVKLCGRRSSTTSIVISTYSLPRKVSHPIFMVGKSAPQQKE